MNFQPLRDHPAMLHKLGPRIMILMVVLVTGTTKNGSETERNYVNFQPLRDHPT